MNTLFEILARNRDRHKWAVSPFNGCIRDEEERCPIESAAADYGLPNLGSWDEQGAAMGCVVSEVWSVLMTADNRCYSPRYDAALRARLLETLQLEEVA